DRGGQLLFWRGPGRSTSPQTTRRGCRESDGCYRCGEQGHIARNCPAPTPRRRALAIEKQGGTMRKPTTGPRQGQYTLVESCGQAEELHWSCCIDTAERSQIQLNCSQVGWPDAWAARAGVPFFVFVPAFRHGARLSLGHLPPLAAPPHLICAV
uniref:CCHC-type domain-containing protein n=1 Tax=Salarias fasciatus TaxID=181472 RepID=A0A672HL81_SALFA